MRIFENANYQFVANRKKAYIFSGTVLLIGLLSFLFRGVEVGIDFLGGMEFVVETQSTLSPNEARSALSDALETDPEVKTFGVNQLLVRTAAEGDIGEMETQILEGLAARFPDAQPQVVQTDIVGPRFAEDLKRGAIYSVIGSLLVIFIYILVRFEWRYGLGAVTALFHDVAFTLAMFSLCYGWMPFSLTIDQTIIAAFMTIVGYSINDTVVIFDRIREYNTIFKTEAFESLANRAINSTLSRTFITSGTVLLSVIVLFIFGGEVLRGFSFAMIVGLLSGTYSTIFIAAPMVVDLKANAAARKR